MKRALLVQVLLVLSYATAMGEDPSLVETSPPTPAGHVLPSQSDAELGRMLSSEDVVENRKPKLVPFNYHQRYLMDHVYLGANGELFGIPHHAHHLPVGLTVYYYRDGLLLVTMEGISELGLNPFERFAQVSPDGRIQLLVEDQAVVAQLSALPAYWPTTDDPNGLRPLHNGEIRFEPTPGGRPQDYPPPEGSIGWALLGMRGYLAFPLEGEPRPENVVWIIAREDGGYTLAYGGPKRQGVLMEISPLREVTLGENTPYRRRSRRPEPTKWAFQYNDGHTRMFPPGSGVYPLSDGSRRMWVSESGILQEEIDVVRF